MSTDYTPRILPASDHAVLVRFGVGPGEGARSRVLQFLQALESSPTLEAMEETPAIASREAPPTHRRVWCSKAIRNVHPAYASVLVSFDLQQWSLDDARDFVTGILASMAQAPAPARREILLPVCYDADFALDLQDVAARHGIAAQEVIARHAAGNYIVSFFGFSPGFPYLDGLSTTLTTPRLAAPRTCVPAGSVAIAGAQAGIYPMDTPGGWRVLGRTPVPLFDAAAWPPAKLRVGDRIRFQPVSRHEFDRLASTGCTLDDSGHVIGGAL